MGQGDCGSNGFLQRLRRAGSHGGRRDQVRRLLAIAVVLDGSSRAGSRHDRRDGPPRRDRVIRFNEEGPDGGINVPAPGVAGVAEVNWGGARELSLTAQRRAASWNGSRDPHWITVGEIRARHCPLPL